MLYKSIFSSTLQTCNLNTFVLENDFEYSPFLLTNLSTTPQFCPPLLLSYTFDVLNLIRQYNQPNTIRYLLYAIYYALCIIHYALCTMRYILCIIHYALYTMHYALFTMHYVLWIMYYALFTMCYALYTMHYLSYTMHYTLFIYTYSNIFTILYVFIRIYYFTWKSGEIP